MENQIKLIITTDSAGGIVAVKRINEEVSKIPGLVDQYGRAIQATGKQIDETVEKGSGGFRTLGFSATKLAEELGIPFRASHQLGEKVSEMARSTFPAWGRVLGAAGVVTLGATVAVSYLMEAHKKHLEELNLEIDALSQLTDKLYENTFATAGLKKAQDDQADSARKTQADKLAEQYQLAYEKLQKFNSEAAAGGGRWKEIWAGLTNLSTAEYDRAMIKIKTDSENTARDASKALETLYQQLLKITNPPQNKEYDALTYQIIYEKEYQNVLKARGVSIESLHNIEMSLFDLETKSIEYKLKTEGREPEQIKKIIEMRKEERSAIEASFAAKQRDADWIERRIKLQQEESQRYITNIDIMAQNAQAQLAMDSVTYVSNKKLSEDKYDVAALGWAKELEGLRQKNATAEQLDIAYATFQKNNTAETISDIQNLQANSLSRDAAWNSAIVQLMAARGDTIAAQQQELEAFDAATDAQLAKLTDIDAMRAYYAQREIERQTLVLTNEQKTNQMRWQAAQQLTGNLTQAFQSLYMAGGKHAHAYFELWKVASISEATVKGIQAAINSYEFGTKLGGPPLGAVMAAASALATGAMIASLEGTNFGGAAAVGTYSANPVTGQPTQQPYQYYYEQDPNNPHSAGTGWRPGEGPGSNGRVYQFNNSTIIAQDSKSFEDMVVGAASKNYKDQGQLYSAVND